MIIGIRFCSYPKLKKSIFTLFAAPFRKAVKKSLSIFFLLSLVAPFLVSFVWLQYQRYELREQVKQEMLSGLDKDELVLLKIARAQLHDLEWEHSHEFEYKGELYDLAEQQQKGDTLFLWCWWDTEETRLNNQLDRLVARALQQDPSNRQNQQQLDHFIKTFYYSTSTGSLSIEDQDAEQGWAYRFCYSGLESGPPAPPPQIA